MKKIIVLVLVLFTNALIVSAQINDPEVEVGKATYYGKRFNNRKTASGAIYKRDELVCAHKKYPFGTKLLVHNPKNDKNVIVEVIDRGPHSKGRIIDLSFAAAKELDIIHHGVATVEVSEYKDTLSQDRPVTDTAYLDQPIDVIPQFPSK